MPRIGDPQEPQPRRLFLLPPPPAAPEPLPAVVPLLRPDERLTPGQDALLTALARRARHGDREARDLLWRAFAPRLEPALRRCARVTWQRQWPRRDGRPWELDDVHQEAWRVFAELIASWDGEGSIVPYLTAYFAWRLRDALRRLAPPPSRASLIAATSAPAADHLSEAEREVLLAQIAAALPAGDAVVLRMRVVDELALGQVARQLGVNRRTVERRWARICRAARQVLREGPPAAEEASTTRASPRRPRRAGRRSARSGEWEERRPSK